MMPVCNYLTVCVQFSSRPLCPLSHRRQLSSRSDKCPSN